MPGYPTLRALLPRLAALLSLASRAAAHGVLSVPRPRAFREGVTCDTRAIGGPAKQDCGEDMYAPLNGDHESLPKDRHGQRRFPVNDWKKHPFKQSIVCRVPNGLQADVPLVQLTAGTTLDIKVDLTAAHPGDGSVFISYDADFPTDRTADMRFFKIATIPQQRLTTLIPCAHTHRLQLGF